MKKIVEYLVITYPNHNGFPEKINHMINGGWQPLGGVCTHVGYSQAMVKYEDDLYDNKQE